MFTIRQATQQDVPVLTRLIRESFRDVAERFQLTPANAPKHPSNCVSEWIQTALEKGVVYYLLEQDGTPCGCVALEQPAPEVCYLERLAVLPAFRRQGYGAVLVARVLAEARQRHVRRVEIGIIAAHTELQQWYERRGFVVKNTTHFAHLPFEVTFMAATL